MNEPTQKAKDAWTKTAEKEKATAKFLKAGTLVVLDPSVAPREEMVEGKFGKRKMFVVQTKDFGAIYLSPTQLMKANDAFNGDYTSALTVTL